MHQLTFSRPDLDAFCLLSNSGVTVTGQHVTAEQAVLECRVVEADQFCRHCGAEATVRGSVVRKVTHVPVGWRPTHLHVRLRRYRCDTCARVWQQDTTSVVAPEAKLSHAAALWALKSVVIDRLSIARVAANLGVSWHTANDAVLTTGRRLLIDDPNRLNGVRVLGVDEHVWRHTRWGNRYVTVVIDLTPVADRTGPARLLDMVPGRSKQTFITWLEAQTSAFRAGIEIVAMDGFTGYKTAGAETLPEATTVMDPFHVVALAGQAVDKVRQRIQQATLSRRGRNGDPLYGIRKVLKTGKEYLTEQQQARRDAVFANPDHAPVKTTYDIYQKIVAAYRNPNKKQAKKRFRKLIASISHGVPNTLKELQTLGRTMKRRADDILAYFDHIGTSNGPTEAINGRIEHLRGTALGFRNLTHYITRALLDTGGFRTKIHSFLR
ncbi:ISL3 family transposase [Pseudoglutamicibacter cumminsii]|uniref:ISL3 family transposase n=1 Tax=Pseudoglutamicibacter cumminsii TaxID=156979 RepID=UPI002ABB0596|nr:ISL3 family transposase [Pseudoglutamicibacter cumminsii]MDZ3745332.1 ISL3 family transposase [Pseudoglutamicibacter cumminsii]